MPCYVPRKSPSRGVQRQNLGPNGPGQRTDTLARDTDLLAADTFRHPWVMCLTSADPYPALCAGATKPVLFVVRSADGRPQPPCALQTPGPGTRPLRRRTGSQDMANRGHDAGRGLGAFIRALMPVRLVGGDTVTYGVWLGVHPEDLQRAFKVWREPEYVDLRLAGLVANDVQPWGLIGKPPRSSRSTVLRVPGVPRSGVHRSEESASRAGTRCWWSSANRRRSSSSGPSRHGSSRSWRWPCPSRR
jgi:hypothetical protein